MNYEELYSFLVSEIQEAGTMHYEEAGYDSWGNFISDALNWHDDIEKIEEILYDDYDNSHWEKIWRETHS